MSALYAAVSPGARVTAASDGPKVLVFDRDAPIALPTYANALAVNPAGDRALLRGRNDRTYEIARGARTVTDVGSAAGTQCVGYAPDGRPCFIESLQWYRFGGVRLAVPKDAGGQYIAGQGWTQVRNDGPRWTDLHGFRDIAGKRLARCLDLPGFVIGMDTRVERILAYDTAARDWWIVWTGHTPIGPDAAAVNGAIVVAISLPGLFVDESQWTRLTAAHTPTTSEDDDMPTTAQWNELIATVKRIEAKVDAQDVKISRALDALDEIDSDPLPEPGPDMPEINIPAVTWLGKASPLEFTVTSHIETVLIAQRPDDNESTYRNDNWIVSFPHTKAGQWPARTNAQGTKYEGNVCVFAQIGGRWYGDTAEWLKAGQTSKRFSNRTEGDSWGLGPHTKHDPLSSWGPKRGEWFGLMVSTPVRDGVEGDVFERSQIYMVRWP